MFSKCLKSKNLCILKYNGFCFLDFSSLFRSLPTVTSLMPVRYRARKCTRDRKAKINKKNRAANLAKARKYIPILKKKYVLNYV